MIYTNITGRIKRKKDVQEFVFTLEEMMLNLAHELVHAKQFITGDLHSSLKVWKRKDYTKTPYRKTPWEKEAYLLEDKLLNKFWR